MAAAAVVAAQHNHVRSDERQNADIRGPGGAANGGGGASSASSSVEGSVAQPVGRPGAPPSGPSGGGSNSDDAPPSGKMRISAAPPLGSSTGSQTPRALTDTETTTRDIRNDRTGGGSAVVVPPATTAPASPGGSKPQGSQTSGPTPAAGPGVPPQGQMNITAARRHRRLLLAVPIKIVTRQGAVCKMPL
jgi:hypothetical protein